MEDKIYTPFKLEFKLDEYFLEKAPADFNPFDCLKHKSQWPYSFKEILDNTVLKEALYSDKVKDWREIGVSFHPRKLMYALEDVMNNDSSYFNLGDGPGAPLQFEPYKGKYLIALDRDFLGHNGFDHKKVKDVVLSKRYLMSQLIKGVKKIVSDLTDFKEYDKIKELNEKHSFKIDKNFSFRY